MSSGVACRAVALCEGRETSLIAMVLNSKRFLDFARNDKDGGIYRFFESGEDVGRILLDRTLFYEQDHDLYCCGVSRLPHRLWTPWDSRQSPHHHGTANNRPIHRDRGGRRL